jgi:DNA primase
MGGNIQSLAQAKDLVKDRVDLADVISKHTRLVKTGNGYKACCPLPGHREKTPSFHIDRQKNLFFCYGCQRGGDVFTFLHLVEGLNFMEALKELSEALNIELPKLSKGDLSKIQTQKSLMDEGFDVLKRASGFYHRVLIEQKAPGASQAWEYLIKKRGMTEKEIEELEIGFAPAGGLSLVSKLKGTPLLEVSQKLGLIRETRVGLRDFFQDRIVIPISDFRGKIRGFSGRVMDPAPEDQPKYKNSSESDWFKKKELLYGLHRADKWIRESGYVCVVEGYFDQWAFDRNQIPSVAAMGVALTEEHLRTLQRFTKKVYLVMDIDRAGIESTKKTLPLLLREGWDARVFSELEGKDPDEWLHSFKGQKGDLERVLQTAPEASEWWVKQLLREARAENENRLQTLRRMKEVWACASDSAHKSILSDLISRALGIGKDEVRESLEEKNPSQTNSNSSSNSNSAGYSNRPQTSQETYRPKQDKLMSKNSWDKSAEETLVWWIRNWSLLTPNNEDEWTLRLELFRDSLAYQLVQTLHEEWKKTSQLHPSFLARKLEDPNLEPLLRNWIFRGMVSPDEGPEKNTPEADNVLNSFRELSQGLRRVRVHVEISRLETEVRSLREDDPRMIEVLGEIQKLRFCLEDRR